MAGLEQTAARGASIVPGRRSQEIAIARRRIFGSRRSKDARIIDWPVVLVCDYENAGPISYAKRPVDSRI